MQKKRWIALAALRKVLTCAICSIALVALFSVHVPVFPSSKVPHFSDPFKLPTKLSAEQSWTLELAPPHLLKAPLPSRKLDGSSGTVETDKLWKPPPNRDFVPCVEPSPNYTSPTESRGYLLVHTNGGLNQMRAGICDMVAVARIINATLVIPELDKRSFWKDSSNFSDVFDEDHFINALANDVKIITKLPKELATGTRAVKHFRSWSGMDYYQEEIASLWEEYEVIRAAKSDSRLANNNLPLDIQKLRCRACYEALRFAPQIEAMGKLLVDRMRSFGSYIALHLRFEEDMLAFSGCTQDLSPAEADELRIIRENTSYWKEKEIDPIERRSKGFCPLTPKEVGIFLSALGYPSKTPIYIAAGKIYGGDSHMAALRSRYPILMSKVVGDRKGAVFGALVEAPLRPTNKKYQGTNDTFVFTTTPGNPVIFRPTGANRYFTLCSTDFLAVGGGGHFALYLDSDLLSGSSSFSETYGNPCLAHSEDFEVKEVELWGFVYATKYEEVLALSRTEAPGICRW